MSRSLSEVSGGKSFDIFKQLVMDTWQRVKSNRSVPGVDGWSLEEL